MILVHDGNEIRYLRTRCTLDTAKSAQIKLWWHWYGLSSTDSLCHYRRPEFSFARYIREAVNERFIDNIKSHLQATHFLERPCDMVDSVGLAHP